MTHKVAYARVRATLCVNGIAPTGTWTVGLYQITGLGGSPGVVCVFGSAVAGSTVAQVAPAAGSANGLESGQFALPSAGAMYALGVNTTLSMTVNSAVLITASLVAYNA